MPRLDGTGPNGLGRMTGKGMGNCVSIVDEKNKQSFTEKLFCFGRGCGRGLNRSFRNRSYNEQNNNIDSLTARAEYLKQELDNLNQTINSLKKKES
ncbi:MAG: DUF5320 domain-containing protein [Elusimicrobiota bacterium]